MAMGELYAGTSGFSFPEWKGNFYPADLPASKWLEFYSGELGTVEINYTFRRMPNESTLTKWKAQASDGFRFTLKAPQRITHFKRLIDTQEDVDEFVRRARLLGEALGTILFQCPPHLAYDRGTIEKFLAGLPPVARYAMEFRHASWNAAEAKEILSEAGVALCGADTEQTPVEELPVTVPYVYLRLRREEYSGEDIANWAGKVNAARQTGADVYCYFKHEGGGLGPAYAKALQEQAG